MKELIYIEEVGKLEKRINEIFKEYTENEDRFSSFEKVDIYLNVLTGLLSRMCGSSVVNGEDKKVLLDAVTEEINRNTDMWVKVMREN